MPTFYPVCVTVALFIALLLFDVIQRTPENINGHIFFGLITTFLMVYLSFKDMELVSWGLLLIPFVVLVTSYFLAYKNSSDSVSMTASTAPTASAVTAVTASCETKPTISTPASISAASKIISDNNLCNV
jgi:hypothetical protein